MGLTFKQTLSSIIFSILILSLGLTAWAEPPPAPWTFLVFINGDNNLADDAAANIRQMEQVGSTARVNVVVQWASEKTGVTKRLFIKQINETNGVSSPVIQNLGTVDMGDYKNLIDFITWGITTYPAQHYFVDVSDHGNGWHLQLKTLSRSMTFLSPLDLMPASGSPQIFQPSDISWDDYSGNFITTQQLGQALAAGARAIGRKIDLYGSDACLMAMPEVAGEMAGSVQYFVGSQETEPDAGWPYDALLKAWNREAQPTAADVAKIVVDTYVASYSGGENGNDDATFSAFDMGQYSRLVSAVTELGQTVSKLSPTARHSVLQTVSVTQNFADPDYGDLFDFTAHLSQNLRGELPESIISDVQSSVGAFVIDNKVTSNYFNAHGISIWLPADSDTFNMYWDKYTSLKFQLATHWGNALKVLLSP